MIFFHIFCVWVWKWTEKKRKAVFTELFLPKLIHWKLPESHLTLCNNKKKKSDTVFFFLTFGSLVLWIYIARLWNGSSSSSSNFIAFSTPQWKMYCSPRLYLFIISWLSARARNPRLSDYNSWTSVWSIVQHQGGGLSAGCEWGVKVLRLHPAGAQNLLISSSRPDDWCRREYASLYYVKKKKKRKKAQFLSAETENQTHNTETSSWSCFWLKF